MGTRDQCDIIAFELSSAPHACLGFPEYLNNLIGIPPWQVCFDYKYPSYFELMCNDLTPLIHAIGAGLAILLILLMFRKAAGGW